MQNLESLCIILQSERICCNWNNTKKSWLFMVGLQMIMPYLLFPTNNQTPVTTLQSFTNFWNPDYLRHSWICWIRNIGFRLVLMIFVWKTSLRWSLYLCCVLVERLTFFSFSFVNLYLLNLLSAVYEVKYVLHFLCEVLINDTNPGLQRKTYTTL